MNNTSRPLDAVAALIMIGVTLSWGLNQVSVELALPEIPPLIQATVRSIGALARRIARRARRHAHGRPRGRRAVRHRVPADLSRPAVHRGEPRDAIHLYG